ncbi:hypothetical protein [Sphingomonas sp.]|uniref:hypothetical protein n=1 Tax=Sphingomonas sp. TaxID=28214 RepID=UPI003AFFF788
MSGPVAASVAPALAVLRGAADRILALQSASGAIPWFEDGPWDAWNHAECVMALGAMGEIDAMRAGLNHLAETQAADGSWLGGYGNALPMEGRLRIARVPAPVVRDTNFTAYPATALWHAWRLTDDEALVRRLWPTVRSAIRFGLAYQHDEGDISWSAEAYGTDADDAVLAGNASIHRSIGDALRLAVLVGDPQPGWEEARGRLRAAIMGRPDRFDRRDTDRSGFAMDWYYPVLSGALSRAASWTRLRFGWRRFVEIGRGCRCVAGEPWATVAETAELAMALIGLGRRREAATLLGWQERHRTGDGAYWMGWQFAEGIAWPQETPGWTQAAMILATDALTATSRAHDVLTAREERG